MFYNKYIFSYNQKKNLIPRLKKQNKQKQKAKQINPCFVLCT